MVVVVLCWASFEVPRVLDCSKIYSGICRRQDSEPTFSARVELCGKRQLPPCETIIAI